MTLGVFSGCMSAYKESLGGVQRTPVSRIYLTDFNTAWQSVLEALKSVPLDVANVDSGLVQTKWVENTESAGFSESYGGGKAFLKSQYRVRVQVSKGFYNGKPSVRVKVLKEQTVQRDALEGWSTVETDRVDERTLLYRIGRLVAMRMEVSRREEERVNRALQESELLAPQGPSEEFE